MPYEVVSYTEIPIPLVKKLLEEEIRRREKVPNLLQSVYEHVKKLAYCPEEAAEKLMEELVSMGFKRITAAMIINIRPRILDELRTLLVFESRVPDEDVLNRVLELLDKHCPLSEK